MNLSRLANDYSEAARTAARSGHRSTGAILTGLFFARFVFKFGPLYYSLFSLDRKSIKCWGDYMLDKEANALVRKINPPSAQELVTDKLGFYQRLMACNFSTIPVLAVITKGHGPSFEWDSRTTISTMDQFVQVADELPDELFLKIIDGAHGDDAFSAIRQGRGWVFAGRVGGASDLYAHCVRVLGDRRGWLIQARVRAHQNIATSLSPAALATVRIVTALDHGGVRIVAALIKIPVGQSETDNFSVGASGNIVAPIDLATGRLGIGQMSSRRSWPEIVPVNRHPDTGYRIPGFELPYWTETILLVSDLQRQFKEAPTLGWDIAMTDEGPLVVEANAGYSVEIHQVAEQRGLRSTLLNAWNSTSALCKSA